MSRDNSTANAIERPILSKNSHFEVLDGLRGVAAYCVFLVHCFGRVWVTNGFLGVDLFFMLSGFVIAYSYKKRLVERRSVGDFALRRFIRLYPMIIVGVALGLCMSILHNYSNPLDHYGYAELAKLTVLALLMVPHLEVSRVGLGTYPLDPVLWSLFFEIVANFVYALFVRRMSKTLLAVVALTGLVVTVAAGPLRGGGVPDFWLGFPRVAFGFFIGVLLWELWSENRLPKISFKLLPLSIVLIAIANYPVQIDGVAFLPVAAIFAVMIVSGANSRPSAGWARVCTFLGAISYPMYLTHGPLLYLITGLAKKLISPPLEGEPYVAVVVVSVIVISILSYAMVNVYETPARRLLTRLLRKQRPTLRLAPL